MNKLILICAALCVLQGCNSQSVDGVQFSCKELGAITQEKYGKPTRVLDGFLYEYMVNGEAQRLVISPSGKQEFPFLSIQNGNYYSANACFQS